MGWSSFQLYICNFVHQSKSSFLLGGKHNYVSHKSQNVVEVVTDLTNNMKEGNDLLNIPTSNPPSIYQIFQVSKR